MMRCIQFLCLCLLPATQAFAAEPTPVPRVADLRDVLGVCHNILVYGAPEPTDYLNEGADRLLELGTRTIKVAFRDEVSAYYLNMPIHKVESLAELAETEPFRKLFAKPFNTFILMTYTPGKPIHYFTAGMTEEDVRREEESLYAVSKHLLSTYKGKGKTFIFSNWEGDWVLTPPNLDRAPWSTHTLTTTSARGMIDWLNARQAGVERARREVGCDGVLVAHAAEANMLGNALDGRPSVVNTVVPHTRCDLYSYSAYDLPLQEDWVRLDKGLALYKERAPDSALFGADNLFLGEMGIAENVYGEAKREAMFKQAVLVALKHKVRYVMLWQLYCDGWRKGRQERRPTNDDLAGNWLIRPDGSKSGMWGLLQKLYAEGPATLEAEPTGKR